jgi:hypothetical protein
MSIMQSDVGPAPWLSDSTSGAAICYAKPMHHGLFDFLEGKLWSSLERAFKPNVNLSTTCQLNCTVNTKNLAVSSSNLTLSMEI